MSTGCSRKEVIAKHLAEKFMQQYLSSSVYCSFQTTFCMRNHDDCLLPAPKQFCMRHNIAFSQNTVKEQRVLKVTIQYDVNVPVPDTFKYFIENKGKRGFTTTLPKCL